MAYLNLDPAFFTHRKTLRLVARLGPGAELLPLKLWAYCAQHHPKDGALRGYEQAELEALLGHGQALLGGAQVVPALVAVGFLEELPDATGWVCHDWLEHQGHLAAFKERAERAAKARWDKARMLKHAPSIATGASEQCNEQCPIPTIPTIPNQLTTLSDSVESDGAGEEIKPKSNRNQNVSRYSPAFESFWAWFPRKIGKGKAWATFKRLNAADQQAAVEQAEAYAQAFAQAPEARRQFFKHPTTWLNARSWEDSHAEWALIIEGK